MDQDKNLLSGDATTSSLMRNETDGVFSIRTANDWLATEQGRQAPKMLFDTFWFEGELCILFADTNVGKSVLAVQIGDSIASGKSIAPFKLEANPCAVLYFDFEQTARQFNVRYSVDGNCYKFSEFFYRAELNLSAVEENTVNNQQHINQYIETAIVNQNANVLIIDNLTYLHNETERSKDALQLMKHLKALKTKYNLSILVLAHTPKRNPFKNITQNDLQGSKMLINFCDSAFAIGQSQCDMDFRYLKQIKQRNTSLEYGVDNICVFRIIKPSNFLMFEFVEYGWEYDHLQRKEYDDDESMEADVIALYKRGFTQRRIADRLFLSLTTVFRTIQKANATGSAKQKAKAAASVKSPYSISI
jgi:hypothetical protein